MQNKTFLARLKDGLLASFDRQMIIDFLKKKTVTLAIKKILGSVAMGGLKVWLIKYIFTHLFEEIAEPLLKLGFRKAGYLYDKVNGNIQVKKLKEAQENNDEDAYDDVVTDIPLQPLLQHLFDRRMVGGAHAPSGSH